ncbi:hypothetical protein [Variovorax sp. J22R115]|uniref:hypothetical protein n=1 Tax=Variovorax sp. J22R115 TaxID=3053509 RepID=UPI002578B88B|nr:hypothetical protein [Variovorax sp. J22R115]MDM0047914.1 hypothetical protein [Variovorax sp. J22R115]
MSSPPNPLPTPPWMGGDSIGLAAWQRSRHVGIAASPANLSVIGGLTSIHDQHTSFVESLSVHDPNAQRMAGDDPRVFRSAVALAKVAHADMPGAGSRVAVDEVAQAVVRRKATADPGIAHGADSGAGSQRKEMAEFVQRTREEAGTEMQSDAPSTSADAGAASVQRSPIGRAESAPPSLPAIPWPSGDGVAASVPVRVSRKHGAPPLSPTLRVAAIGKVSALRPVSLAVRAAMAASSTTSPGDVAGGVPGAASSPRRGDLQRHPADAPALAVPRSLPYRAPVETVPAPRVILRAPSMPLRRALPSVAQIASVASVASVALSHDRQSPTPALDRVQAPASVADLAGAGHRPEDGIAPLPISTIHDAAGTRDLGTSRMGRAVEQSGHTSGAVPADAKPAIMSAMRDAPSEAEPVAAPASAAMAPSPPGHPASIARRIETSPVVVPMEQARAEVDMPLPIRSAAQFGEPTTSPRIALTADRADADAGAVPPRTGSGRAVAARAERLPPHGPAQVIPVERTLPASRPPETRDVARMPATHAMPMARIAIPSRVAGTGETPASRAVDSSAKPAPALAQSATTTQWRTLAEAASAPATISDAAPPSHGVPQETELTGRPVQLTAAASSLEQGIRRTEAPAGRVVHFTVSAPGHGMPLVEVQPRPGLSPNHASEHPSSTERASRIDLAPVAASVAVAAGAGSDVGVLRHRTGIARSRSRQEPGAAGPTGPGDPVPQLVEVHEVHPRKVAAVSRQDVIGSARSLALSDPMQLASVAIARRAQAPRLHGDEALPLRDGDAGAVPASATQTLLRRSTLPPGTDAPAPESDALAPIASLPGETAGAVHVDGGAGNDGRNMPLLAAPFQRRTSVDGTSPDAAVRAAPAIARMIDMPLVRHGGPASAGSASSSQVARVAQPRMADPGSVDVWSPEVAGPPPSGLTTVHPAQPEQRGAHPEVDVDDIVERAWGALMSRLATEHERRGFARWA